MNKYKPGVTTTAIYVALVLTIVAPDSCYAQTKEGGMDHSKMDHSDMGGGNTENMSMRSVPGSVAAPTNQNLAIGRMKITLMPEYDSPSVLVIQEGKFADRTAFPNTVSFLLPDSITKLTDVCSLSPGGHHFCQIFEIKTGDTSKYVDVKLPFSDFFIDYQYAPFTVKENNERNFTFTIDTKYDVNTLEVHVQKPHRAKHFKVSPAMIESYEKSGFDYQKRKFTNISAGEKKVISVSYFKADTSPSVDIKFSVMSTPTVFTGYSGEIVLGVGVLSLLALWYLRRRISSRGKS
ncbi:hypothetical protein MNBD_NITROSPINAE02-1204 [hydrothermal vent metagenome]|uniref:Uncharacterized protein n=1 Tax=hydrothermal vent metagenome TaxID=652676 RepID=A0A3B1CBH3_9ZZZZ